MSSGKSWSSNYRPYGFGFHTVASSECPGGAQANKTNSTLTNNGLHHRQVAQETPASNNNGSSHAYMKLHLSQLQRLLANVEFAIHEISEGNGDCTNQRKSEISQEINGLLRNIEQLYSSFNQSYDSSGPEARRTLVPLRTRIGQLQQGAKNARQNLQQLMSHEYSSKRAEKEREELFRGAGSTSGAQFIAINEYTKEKQSLEHSHQMIDEYTEIASAVSSRLRQQRETLKGAQRRVLDMISSLSIGRSLIRAIERRSAGDKAIVYGGMIVTLLVLYLAWKYVRSNS